MKFKDLNQENLLQKRTNWLQREAQNITKMIILVVISQIQVEQNFQLKMSYLVK